MNDKNACLFWPTRRKHIDPILMLPSNVGCPNGAATGWKTYSNAACRRIMLSDAARSKRVVHEYANLASD